MSRLHEYNPEFGIVFDEVDDFLNGVGGTTSIGTGGGGTSTIIEEETAPPRYINKNGPQGYGAYAWDGKEYTIWQGDTRAPQNTTNNITIRPPSGTDFLKAADLIAQGYIEVSPGLYERYDPATKRISQYQGNRQETGEVLYQLKYIGAPPKGYVPPSGASGAAATTAEGTTTPAAAGQFPIETHGSSEPVFDRSGELQYQYNDPETNTSYSKGYEYADVKKERAADIREQQERERLAAGADPFAFANGGNFLAKGPQMITDMSTGQPTGIFGEAGQEMATFTPVDKPVTRDPFAMLDAGPFRGGMPQDPGPPDSLNLIPHGYRRNPFTMKLEPEQWYLTTLMNQQRYAGGQGVPRFEDGGTVVTAPEAWTPDYGNMDTTSLQPPAPASPQIQPLPGETPIVTDPFANQPWNTADERLKGLLGKSPWGGKYVAPPIQNELPPDIRAKYDELRALVRGREAGNYKYGIAGLSVPPRSLEDMALDTMIREIEVAATDSGASSNALGFPTNISNNPSGANALRQRLGLPEVAGTSSSPGASPGSAPSVGSRPLPADPFALFNKAFSR